MNDNISIRYAKYNSHLILHKSGFTYIKKEKSFQENYFLPNLTLIPPLTRKEEKSLTQILLMAFKSRHYSRFNKKKKMKADSVGREQFEIRTKSLTVKMMAC